MKKLLLGLFCLLLLTGCATRNSSSNFEILTLFSSDSKNENKLWVGTFQLVFNDMKNNIIKKDIIFKGFTPTKDLIGLNKEEFKVDCHRGGSTGSDLHYWQYHC